MDTLLKGCFTENNELWPGVYVSLEVEEILHEEHSPYQKITLLKTKNHGKLLILDDIIQCSEYDEFAYHEMVSFLSLQSHPNPKKVLIVGGGDGGVAREVCKHASVEEVSVVEIDLRVFELSKKFLPSISKGFSNPKVKEYVEDGFKFIENHQQEFDVIITDSSDPIGWSPPPFGPAIPLFQEKYFELLRNVLRPGGIVCSQIGTVWASSKVLLDVYSNLKKIFPVVSYAYTSTPLYPTGQIGFVFGSLNKETNFKQPLKILNKAEENEMKLRYYTSDMHRAAFSLPKFVEDLLNGSN